MEKESVVTGTLLPGWLHTPRWLFTTLAPVGGAFALGFPIYDIFFGRTIATSFQIMGYSFLALTVVIQLGLIMEGLRQSNFTWVKLLRELEKRGPY